MAISKNYGVLGKFSMGCKAVDIEVSMKDVKWKDIPGFPGYEINKFGDIIDYKGEPVLPNDEDNVFLYRLVDGKMKKSKRKLENLLEDVFTPPKKIKQVLVKDLEGNLIGVYPNRYQAGKAVGVTPQQVGTVCNGVTKSSKGYVFTEFEIEDTEE